MTTRNRLLLRVAFAAFLPPVAVWLTLFLIPDTVTRIADAGTFISATAAPGGFGSGAITSVRTNTGSFIINGVYASADVRQTLVVEDTTHAGLQLCVRGQAGSCATLASGYAGPMRNVAPPPLGVSHGMHKAGVFMGVFWFLIGATVLMLTYAVNDDADDGNESGSRPSN